MGLIALVEDESGVVVLMWRYMENSPFEYRFVAFVKATEALSYVERNKVNLLISDIQLLGYRGTELARQLRSMLEYRSTPILFTTELAEEELPVYREIKCYDFPVKPSTEDELQRTLKATLEMGEQMQVAPKIPRIEQKQFLSEYEIGGTPYIESFGKKVFTHTAQDGGSEVTDQVSGHSPSRLLNMAPQNRLLQCHKSSLVSPVYTYRIDKANRLFYLEECKTAVPIGEKYQKAMFGHELP